MAQAHVKHATIAVLLAPSDWNVIWLADFLLHFWRECRPANVEAHQYADLFGLPVLELIDFVGDCEFLTPGLANRMLGIVDDDRHCTLVVPGMFVKRTAEHFPIGLIIFQ